MKATIDIREGGRIDPSHRREKAPYNQFTLKHITKETPTLIIMFFNTPMTTYCCAWGTQELNTAASSFSRGYGYNREAKSFSMAMTNMGITFDREIFYKSDEIDAMYAIGEAIWPSVKGVIQFIVSEQQTK